MTTRTPKLTDLQRMLLTTAAQRSDGHLPPPEQFASAPARVRTAAATLLKRQLVGEAEVAEPVLAWRADGEQPIGLLITNAGRTIIDVASAEAPEPVVQPIAAAPDLPPAKPLTKAALVLDLLRRDNGATLAELVAATGWLPHTTRAALTGLRKRGNAIQRCTRDNASCYKLEAA